MVRHRFKLVMHPGRVEVSLPEHVAIIDAVCARKPEQAEAVMREHLRSVITGLREVLQPLRSSKCSQGPG